MSIYNQDRSLPFCTYITIYKGNLLPPFYIGYSTSHKVLDGTYHGSVVSKKYKKLWLEELKHSPHLFITKPLSFHNTKIESLEKERHFLKFFNCKDNPLFINQTNGNWGMKGKHSDETRAKMSKSGKGKPKSPEHKQKLSEANRNRPIDPNSKFSDKEWQKEKGKKIRGDKNGFFGKKHTEESRRKMSIKASNPGEKNPNFGKIWIVNHNSKQKLRTTLTLAQTLFENGWSKGLVMSYTYYHI